LLVAYAPELFSESNINPFDYARITDVDYTAVVVDEPGSDGKVIITERLTFDVYAASENNLFWELWRALPEEYIDGVKVEYKVNSVKQVFEDQYDITYSESPKLYWDDSDYTKAAAFRGLGPGKWYHSKGPYDESRRQYECVLIYVNGLYRETVVFEIEYEMYNAALRYSDSSELYVSLYSEGTINYLKSFSGQFLIPEEKMPREGNYYAHAYGTNSHVFPFRESKTVNPGYHTFSFKLNNMQLKFKPYNEYIEFALVSYGEDKHIFTQHASKNDYYNDDVLAELREEQAKYEELPEKWSVIKAITCTLFLVGAFLTMQFTYWGNKKKIAKQVLYKPSMQMDYFREIPSELDPNFAAALVFCKHKLSNKIENGYSAVMLSLVHKGYIELEKIQADQDWSFSNTKIMVKRKPMAPLTVNNELPENIQGQITQKQIIHEQIIHEQLGANIKPLTPTEEQYFNLILRHSNGIEISLSSFQEKISDDYENTNSFVKGIKSAIINIGVSQGYFQKADYKGPKKEMFRWSIALGIIGVLLATAGNLISSRTRLDLAFGGFYILGAGFIVSAFYLYLESKKYILLTQFGEDEYAKWRGLYNFLSSETLMSERTVVELVLWEQYLIYATAFGISEKVINAINIRCPNRNESPILRNHYNRPMLFYFSSRSFRIATRTASFTARTGGFGGYGGGGRGGGGGGGGH
jgi:uncharacterized membrane protein